MAEYIQVALLRLSGTIELLPLYATPATTPEWSFCDWDRNHRYTETE